LEAYYVHRTVEFRQHQGTIDFEDIAAWVSLTQGFVGRATSGKAMRMRSTTRPFESFMLAANACAAVRRHYAARYAA
ncbi:MAG: amidoligase family protein, partial [Methanothrix sp.]